MRIFYDHQAFSLLSYGGIPRYYTELTTGINHTPDHNAYLPLLVSNNIHLQEVGVQVRPFFTNTKFPKKIHTIYKLNEIYNIYKICRKPFDIFHATYYDPYFLPYLQKKPFVITFLDMIHEKFGHQFKELAYDGVITEQKRKLAHRADRIIAISESTKKDIVELLNVDPSKIEVIYLGSSLALNPSNSKSEDERIAPYLLFVGNRSMYKNFSGMLKAIHPLLKQFNIELLCAGGGAFSKSEIAIFQSLGVNNIVKQVPINDKILINLYQNAFAFIFPSLYEGFGIPVLESFACGCPCIVSNVSSLPEVAGKAALYIDPTSSESISHGVKSLLESSELRNSLIQRGYEQLASFSWKRTVSETLDLYQKLI